MINLLWSGLFIMLALSGCGWNGAPTRHNDFVPLTSIEIVAVSPTIAAHTSTNLTVNGNFSGLFTRDVTDQAVWSSDTPTVADFVTAGSPNRVTGLSPGTAVLTATVGGVSTTFRLTVSSATITHMTITPADPSIAKGRSTQFAVSGNFSDGTTQVMTFDADWASSAPDVATVSNVPTSKGFAQSLAVGASTITATFEGVSGTTLLTVTEVVLQSITVSPPNPSILSLSTGSFHATGTYSDGSTADITSLAAWNSSRSGIATISGGAAKTLSQGTTTISATLAGVSGTSTLKVTGGNLTGIVLSSADLRPVRGTTSRLTATGSFSNGTSRDVTGGVEWSVASTSVATVTTPGGNQAWLNALAVASIPTTVTAQFGSVTATTNLTVIAPLLQSIAISPTSLDLTVGTSDRFTVTATFNDGTTQDVTANANWISSVSTAAAVGNTGLAKGQVSGISVAAPVIITAAYGGLTATATVTVRARILATLVISSTPAVTVVSGNQVKFTATATYTDGTSKDVTEDTTWSIDKPNVAILADSLSQPGQVVAVDTGSATLTAGFPGKTQTVTVTVP